MTARLPRDYGHVLWNHNLNDASTITKDGSNLISQVLDLSASNITLTSPVGKQPTWTPNAYNQRAMAFFNGNAGSGIEFYLTAGDVQSYGTAGHTIFIFGKHANSDSQMYISKHNGGTDSTFFLAHTTSSNMQYTTVNAASTRVDLSGSPFAADTFHIIAARADFINNKVAIFKNGKKISEATQTGPFKATTAPLMLGSYAAFATFSLTGYIGHNLGLDEPLDDWAIREICDDYIRPIWGFWDE